MSYAQKPIYLFGGTGLGLISGSFLVLVYLIYRRLAFMESINRSPLLQMTITLFILGFQSILMGLIAELLVRTYHESQEKPTYIVREALNVKAGEVQKEE